MANPIVAFASSPSSPVRIRAAPSWILPTTSCTSSVARTGVTSSSTSDCSSGLRLGSLPWSSNSSAGVPEEAGARPVAPHVVGGGHGEERRLGPPASMMRLPGGEHARPARRARPTAPRARRRRIRSVSGPAPKDCGELVEAPVVELRRHLDDPAHALTPTQLAAEVPRQAPAPRRVAFRAAYRLRRLKRGLHRSPASSRAQQRGAEHVAAAGRVEASTAGAGTRAVRSERASGRVRQACRLAHGHARPRPLSPSKPGAATVHRASRPQRHHQQLTPAPAPARPPRADRARTGRISSSFICTTSKQPNQAAGSASGWSMRTPSCCMPRKRLCRSA